jgi:hypothetical protein
LLSQPVVDVAPDLLADDPLAPGTVIGTYTIVREIGRSGSIACDRRRNGSGRDAR